MHSHTISSFYLFITKIVQDANITPSEEEPMCEDPFDLTVCQWKDEIIHKEVPKDRATTEQGEAETTAPGSEVEELFGR